MQLESVKVEIISSNLKTIVVSNVTFMLLHKDRKGRGRKRKKEGER